MKTEIVDLRETFKTNNEIRRELIALAEGECTCSNDYDKCDSCKAAGALNEMAEIARETLSELNYPRLKLEVIQ